MPLLPKVVEACQKFPDVKVNTVISHDEWRAALAAADADVPSADGYFTSVELARIWGLSDRQARRKVGLMVDAGKVLVGRKIILNRVRQHQSTVAYKLKA